MPYKNDDDKRACYRRYYRRHTDKVKAATRARKRENQKWYREYKKTLKCAMCGETYWACLDFHHTDPSIKDNIISRMVADGVGIEKIKEEIAKCVVLCSNCHRKFHNPV